jgi:hypothetical protein
MKTTHSILRFAAATACLFGLTSLASAQTTSMNFSLDDVWLLPDVSNPGDPAVQMTGTFRWTYPAGQFENGSGEFLNLNIPWYGTDIQGLIINIDLPSIEFVKRPPVTTVDVDLMMFFLSDLDPNQPAVINTTTSIFEVQSFGVSHQGHLISGAVVADAPLSLSITGSCPDFQFSVTNATRLERVALLRAGGLGTFVVPTGKPCAGTLLGLSGSVSLAKMLTANGAGQASFSVRVPAGACGTVFLQALDLSTCRVSTALQLP